MEELINQVLQNVKLRPGISNNADELLKDLINDVINDVKDYINYSDSEELPSELISAVKELVIIKCNTLGTEGLNSQSSNGVSENYSNDIPKPIKKKLNRYRKCKW